MKEFEVTITETLQKTVNIEAETKEEAAQLVKEMWDNGDIILDSDNFADVEYAANNGKEIEKLNELEVLLIEPGQYAKMTTIGAGLSSMQEIVGGNIQAAHYFNEPVVLVCNRDSKTNGSELNRAIKDENGKMIDIVAGTFFICGAGEEDFTSLPPEHKAKFEKMFKNPEAFLKMGKGIMAIPCDPKTPKENKVQDNKLKGQEL